MIFNVPNYLFDILFKIQNTKYYKALIFYNNNQNYVEMRQTLSDKKIFPNRSIQA